MSVSLSVAIIAVKQSIHAVFYLARHGGSVSYFLTFRFSDWIATIQIPTLTCLRRAGPAADPTVAFYEKAGRVYLASIATWIAALQIVGPFVS